MSEIRKAKITDVSAMQKLINDFADRGDMLHRSLNDLYENIRDFYVLETGGQVKGCCALHVSWGDLAEVKALVVADELQGQGWGRRLVEKCVADARELSIPKVFTLTYKPGFFVKVGFAKIDMDNLPRKIWSECINCPKYPDCGEEALVREA
ncbi:MAG: N-acetyltransferase [Armatimonadota bacterium]